MNKQRIYCPECRGNNTYSMEIYKEAFRGYRKMMRKYKCKDCGKEFWK